MCPPQTLSEREVGRFRERLVEVAGRLFAERGYEGVTLRAIAGELGCSAMTPYRYFRDKGEIFAAVRSAAYTHFAQVQETALASSEEPVERLSALGYAYVRFAAEHPHPYRLMFGLSQPDPDGYPELREAELRSWQPLRGAIGEMAAEGLIEGDPDTVAHVFWCGVHGLASLHLAGKLALGRDLEDLLVPMLHTLLRGNRPPPSEDAT